jgi:hypothetical protein
MFEIGSVILAYGEYWQVESVASYATGNRVQLKGVGENGSTLNVNEDDLLHAAKKYAEPEISSGHG